LCFGERIWHIVSVSVSAHIPIKAQFWGKTTTTTTKQKPEVRNYFW